MKSVEIEFSELLAAHYETGRGAGFDEGVDEGLRRAAERIEAMITERLRVNGNSRYDTCTTVLRDAAKRLGARVSDITPEGVTSAD